jgi:hypothetical protein
MGGHCPQRRGVDRLPRTPNRTEFYNRFPSTTDLDSLTGFGTRYQIAQMRFGVGEINSIHRPFQTKLLVI